MGKQIVPEPCLRPDNRLMIDEDLFSQSAGNLHEFLLQPGSFASAVAQEIQVSSADARMAFNDYFFNARRA